MFTVQVLIVFNPYPRLKHLSHRVQAKTFTINLPREEPRVLVSFLLSFLLSLFSSVSLKTNIVSCQLIISPTLSIYCKVPIYTLYILFRHCLCQISILVLRGRIQASFCKLNGLIAPADCSIYLLSSTLQRVIYSLSCSPAPLRLTRSHHQHFTIF